MFKLSVNTTIVIACYCYKSIELVSLCTLDIGL